MALDQIQSQDIYIGGLFALRNRAALSKRNITHVVSVLRLNPEESFFEGYSHLKIAVDDVEDENLLEHFATANAFIQSGLDAGGSVLVHCAMGKSRSATICIAYLMHRQPNVLTPKMALDSIRQTRPMCEPNGGFMEQLELYHRIGCPDDVTTHPVYKRWVSHRQIESSTACGVGPDMDVVQFEDEVSPADMSAVEHSSEIRCRRCRRMLATSSFIMEHKQSDLRAGILECAHVFLHPLTWMRPCLYPGQAADHQPQREEAPLSGRLTCPNPKCEWNVGKFAWQGMKCSCGTWIVPAIGVARAKVDIVDKKSNQNAGSGNSRLAMGIRLPPHIRAAAEESERGSL